MTKGVKLCPYCGLEMNASHGNRRYHKACAYEAKKRRSIKQYAKQHLHTDPYWFNEKILRELYNKYGEQFEIDPLFLKQQGFDYNKCKTKRKFNGYDQFFMHQYGFSIQQNKKIILWKL